MLLKIFIYVSLTFWTLCNTYVAFSMTAADMKHKFYDGQCRIGIVCANLFYFPAWIAKFFKAAIA